MLPRRVSSVPGCFLRGAAPLTLRELSSTAGSPTRLLRHLHHQPPGSASGPNLPWYRSAAPRESASSSRSSVAAAAAVSSGPTVFNPVHLADPLSPAAPCPSASSSNRSLQPSPQSRAVASQGPVAEAPPVKLVAVPSPQTRNGGLSAAPSGGALRATPARRMSALSGPSLESRIEDLVKIEESIAAEMLPQVVQLLIDPNADGVERISLADFAAMQPKRQLVALGGKKQWHDFIIASSYYQQVVRLTAESPAHDLKALQQAGIFTLHQWAEQPSLVRVSARTRSALNAAVEYSITTYMQEVALVVNTSNQLASLMNRWVADVLGKFMLDSLKISVESASAAFWKRRAHMAPPSRGGQSGAGTDSDTPSLMLLEDDATSQPVAANTTTVNHGGRPVLRPGEACTLEHFHSFVLKVAASVRRDYIALNVAMGSGGPSGRGDAQSEAEIMERTHTVIATALTQLLEQAVQQHLPTELKPLRDNGYLALDRVPALLRRAVSALQLRSLPVRSFVFHSTADAAAPQESASSAGSGTSRARTTPSTLDVNAVAYAPGTFLTGSEAMHLTLGEWNGSPDPPSSTGRDDVAQLEYASILHRLRRRADTVSSTSLHAVLQDAEAFGAYGFNASEAIGLDQLFGPAKLVEDRLVSLLHYPPATTDKPLHFVEAGRTTGKTAILEGILRRTRPGERTVLVRYGGSAAPFVPDLDDHPLAFASRLWFRVALASCPFLIRTEELFSRAPRSVMWWGNPRNWSWESVQALLASAHSVGRSRTAPPGSRWAPQLSAILVDDFDRVLNSMERKWGVLPADAATGIATSSTGTTAAREGYDEEDADEDDEADGEEDRVTVHQQHLRDEANALTTDEQRQQVMALYLRTGKTVPELLTASLAKVTTALGQVSMVFTGDRVSPLLQAHAMVPCRRYFIPVANGVGLQQRLRVLPLMSVLHAQHLRAHLELPGLLYEVVKNCPALAGKALELFWSSRIATMDLRTAPARLSSGDHHSWLAAPSGAVVQSYAPRELFAELPLRNTLLQNARRTRLRLVELLQRQLSSPTGFLNTGIDTTAEDHATGLVTPHNHTTSQVPPFALFVIFSHQDAMESALTRGSAIAPTGGGHRGGQNEKRVVRAWAEVWWEYRAVVQDLATTPERKRDAMRVLLHGALLLRSAAVAGATLDLNLKVPPYGFPLLASGVRVKVKHGSDTAAGGGGVRPATADTVRKAAAAYKSFFSTATRSHYPFRPIIGLNGGCDIVFISGATMGLYDMVTTAAELREVVYRYAEALLGVLHALERQVLPVDMIRHVQYVTVVSIDHAPSSSSRVGDVMANPEGHDHGASSAPYFIDIHAVFPDSIRDRLRLNQEPLGITTEFRTLSDLLDQLASRFHVRAQHEVMSSHAELESLFSPTLLQLVPDATVLPPYTSAVVTAEDLMLEAMRSQGTGAVHTTATMGGDEDDEDEADGLADGVTRGAEVEDVNSERLVLSDVASSAAGGMSHDLLLADHEHIHESAELLEAMLNDQLDGITDTSMQEAAMAKTAEELQHDNLLENHINYSTHAPLTAAAAASIVQNATPAGGSPGITGSSGANQTSHSGREIDSLAWLHDIITSDSLLAGLQDSASPPHTVYKAAVAAGTRSPATPLQESHSSAAAAAPGAGSRASAGDADEEEDVDEKGWSRTLQESGVESTESVFPVTAAKRAKTRHGRHAASSSTATPGRGKRMSVGGAADATNGGRLDLEKLLHTVKSRTSRSRKASVASSSSSGNKKGSGTRGAKNAKPSAPTTPKPKKVSAASLSSRTVKSGGKTSAARKRR